MMIDGFLLVFSCGSFGGFLGELLKWYRLREAKKLPHYATSFFYWFITVTIILSGGIVATLYGTEKVNALMAVNIGITTPLLIQSLAASYDNSSQKKSSSKNTRLDSDNELSSYLGLKKYSLLDFLSS